MNFDETLQYLEELNEAKMRLELEPSQVMLECLGRPDRSYPSVIVGGTNGKGSTCEILTSILVKAGYQVGTYTSPHLRAVRERIRLNGEWLSEEDFASYATTVRKKIGHVEGLTYFEFLTMVATLAFQELHVDWAVFEVGLGGRLDTTNALDRQLLGVSRIGFDHETILGPEIEKIAGEKAALIRKDIGTFSVRQLPEVEKILEEHAERESSTMYFEGRDFCLRTSKNGFSFEKGETAWTGLIPSLKSPAQVQNFGLALALVDEIAKMGFSILPADIKEAVEQVRIPCRQERRVLASGQELLLDVAHNLEATQALAEYLSETGQTWVIVFGAAADKNWKEMIRALRPFAKTFTFVPIASPRSWDPQDGQRLALNVAAHVEDDPKTAFQNLLSSADRILCTGSFYLMGGVLDVIENPS